MFGPTNWWLGADPFRELQNLQKDMNRIFSSIGESTGARQSPAVNALSSGNSVIVTAELPGIDIEKLNISVQNDTLTLSGSRESESLGEGDSYQRQERSSGPFTRILKLPFRTDASKVEASYKKGILTIVLPRTEEDKPKKIAIKAA